MNKHLKFQDGGDQYYLRGMQLYESENPGPCDCNQGFRKEEASRGDGVYAVTDESAFFV